MNGIKRICFMLFIYCFCLSVSVSVSADVVSCIVWYDLEDFSALRTAVLNEDAIGVQSFFESGEIDDIHYGKPFNSSFDYGKYLLEFLDQQHLLFFEKDPEGMTDIRLKIYYGGDEHSEIYYWFSEWYISSMYYPGVIVPWSDYTCDDPDFVLETIEGEEVRFKKHNNRNYYLAHHLLSNGKKVVLTLAPSSATADISNPPIDKIGKLSFVPFAELTPAIEIAPSGGESASFPWLWLALPVGAAVIVGAAFVLIRKKRRTEN